PANSTNQKTIGINKLGTLLSSQTTGATGTKHDQTIMSSLRSNFTSLPLPVPFSKSAGSRIPDPLLRAMEAGEVSRFCGCRPTR
ncbi:hypothetical protein, partial [Arthrobacter sp. B0490]|uniref:hypothetical protein n=1 Tax=Arthrobacter sp. B0490 TaxID=2058891 RepID=UPI001CA4DC15